MSPDDIENCFKDIICRQNPKIQKDMVRPGIDLVADLGYDSIQVIEIIVELEQEYEIDLLELEEGLTILNLADYDKLLEITQKLVSEEGLSSTDGLGSRSASPGGHY